MKRTCCKSVPRCSSCPALFVAQQRFLRKPETHDAFLAARGGDLRELPGCVVEALERLDERVAAGATG